MPIEPKGRFRLAGVWALRVLVALLLLGAGLGVVAAGLYFFWIPSFAEDKVRERLVRLSERLGQQVTFSHLEMVSAERAVLHSVVLARHEGLSGVDRDPVVTIPRIEVEVDPFSVLSGTPDIDTVTLIAPHIKLIRTPDGRSDLDPLIDRLNGAGKGQGGDDKSIRARRLPHLKVVGGTMRIKDSLDKRVALPARQTLQRMLRKARSPVEFVRDIEVDANLAEGLGAGTSIKASAVLEPTSEPLPVTLPREVSLDIERTAPEAPGDRGWRIAVDLKPTLIVSRLPKLPFARVTVEGVRLDGPEAIVARGVTVTTRGFSAPLLTAKEVEVQMADLASLQPGEVTLTGATFRLETHKDGSNNLSTLYALARQPAAHHVIRTARALAEVKPTRRRGSRKRAEAPDPAPAPKIPKAALKLMEILPTALAAKDSKILWVHHGRSVKTWTAKDLNMSLTHRVVAQKLDLDLSFTDPANQGSKLSLSLGYGEGQEIETRFEGLDLISLMHHVEAPGHKIARKGALSGEVGVIRRHRGGPVRVNADIQVNDLGFFHRKVAREPVEGLDFGISGRLIWRPERGDLVIERGRFALEKAATVRFNVSLMGIGHGEPRAPVNLRAVSFDVAMDDTEAQAIFDAVPLALKREVDGMRFRGKVGLEMSAKIDPLRIDKMQTNTDVRLKNFDIVDYNEQTDIRKLNRGFVHTVIQPETGYRFRIKADGPQWVPLRRISGYVVKALRTNEDGSFYSHRGFSWMQIRATIAQNIKAGRVVRGASTVSMQLVKNVFLSHERTAARKMQEALLTFAMEQVERVPKSRILETYLNIVEWGPNVYGIRRAARYYFNKSAGGLNVGESVFLISILPGPRKFHTYKERGYISDHWWARMQRLIDVMLERKHIDEETHAAAIEKRPWFRRARGGDLEDDLDEEEIPEDEGLGDLEDAVPR